MREPIERVDRPGPPGAELRLDAHATDVRGIQGEPHHRTDLVVVHAEGRGHRQRCEDAGLGQALEGSPLDVSKVTSAMMARRRLLEPVELQVHLYPFPARR